MSIFRSNTTVEIRKLRQTETVMIEGIETFGEWEKQNVRRLEEELSYFAAEKLKAIQAGNFDGLPRIEQLIKHSVTELEAARRKVPSSRIGETMDSGLTGYIGSIGDPSTPRLPAPPSRASLPRAHRRR